MNKLRELIQSKFEEIQDLEASPEKPDEVLEQGKTYFSYTLRRRYVNSEGIDVTVSYPSSTVEVVVNARNDEHEIELYRMYTSGTCDKENLVKEITKTLNYGKDRLVTIPTPSLDKATVLFTTSETHYDTIKS